MDFIGGSGVLLARAWPEPNACGGVRVRVMWSAVATSGESSTVSGLVVVETSDDLFAVVAGWLARVVDSPSSHTLPDLSTEIG
jgi:hypothetical protein